MKKLLLILFALPFLSSAQTTIFSQNFTSSSVVSDYASASTPNSSQFNTISTSGVGTVIDINSGKLRYARTGNAGSFSRTTDFSPAPEIIVYKLDLLISGNSAATTTAAVFQVGSGFGTSNGTESNANTHSRFAINFTVNAGEFTLRDLGTSTNSSAFSGSQTITWVINNSSTSYSYTPPSGSGTETLASDTWDLYIGTTQVFNDRVVTTSTQTLTDLKFAFTSGVGSIEIDNISIQSIDIVPPTFTALYPKADNINGTSFDLISNINEIGTTYYVVIPDGATAPTSAQVAAGNDASNAAAGFSGFVANAIATTDYFKSVTGLTLNTAYDIYVVAKDAANNFQASPVKLDVTTLTTLPITLTSFTGKESNKSIVLNWVTTSEKNNKTFELFRAIDGKNFKSIGTVAGAGDSNAELKYSFVDANPFGGTNYYQLKQIDFDGKSSTSHIIPVDSKIEDTKITVYASSAKVNIGITSPNETTGKLSLFDISGRKISEQNINLNKGYNSIELNENLNTGIHLITLENEGRLYRQKFVK